MGVITFGSGPGAGLGKVLMSNNAYLQPVFELTQAKKQATCESFDGTQFYATGDTYFKKLPSKRDYIVASMWNDDLLESGEYVSIETGANFVAAADGRAKDCNVQYQANSPPAGKQLNYVNASYCSTGTAYCPFMSGTDGDFSSEHCVSKFGLQDIPGASVETTSDYIIHTNGGTSLGATIDSSHDYMSMINLKSDTFPMANITHTTGPYYNGLLGLTLSCSGASGYNDDRLLAGFHQCQEDDMISSSNFYLWGNQYLSIAAVATGNYEMTAGSELYSGGTGGRLQGSFAAYPQSFVGWHGWHILTGFRCVYEVP
jgi:hypothetical protein